MSREDTWIRAIKQGDKDRLEELIAFFYPAILRYCYRILGCRQSAEDATQETFLRLCRGMSSYTHKGMFKAYLYKIAKNTCLDLTENLPHDPLTETPELEQGYSRAESDTDFDRMISVLPTDQREVVILRFAHDLSLKEIAEILELPLRTVQSRLRYALQKIKKIYNFPECKDVSFDWKEKES